MQVLKVFCFLAGLLTAAQADARLLDEFSTPQPPTVVSVSEVDPEVIGDERDVGLYGSAALSYETRGGSGQIVASSGSAGVAVFVYDGSDGAPIPNSFGLIGEDVRDDGDSGSFFVELSRLEDSVAGTPLVQMQIRLYEDASNFVQSANLTVTTPGLIEVPFASFVKVGSGSDTRDLHAIQILISGLEAGETIAVDHFGTGGSGLIDGYSRPQPTATIPVFQPDPDVEGDFREVVPQDLDVRVDNGVMHIGSATQALAFSKTQYNAGGPGLASFDPTRGGAHDHFAIDIFEVQGPSNPDMVVEDSSGSSWVVGLPVPFTAGRHQLLFSDFEDLDITDLAEIQLRFTAQQLGASFVEVDRFETAAAPPIDDFGDTQPSLASVGTLAGDTIEGGERDVILSPPNTGSVQTPNGDLLVWANGGALDFVDILYDGSGDDPLAPDFGLGSLDFEAVGRDAFGLEVESVPTPLPVTMTVWTGTSILTRMDLTKVIETPGLAVFPFALFSGPSPFPFSDIDQISLSIGPMSAGASIRFSRFTVVDTVPEPAGVLSLAAGLGLLRLFWAKHRSRVRRRG